MCCESEHAERHFLMWWEVQVERLIENVRKGSIIKNTLLRNPIIVILFFSIIMKTCSKEEENGRGM
jgi:hypothetical protein